MEAVKRLTAEKPVVILGRVRAACAHTFKSTISSFGANLLYYELETGAEWTAAGEGAGAALGQRQRSLFLRVSRQELVGERMR
ncbi:UNVERIFIED_CONTAM: hypothetical protein Sradi_7262600 [Sesamum radiatum]|uniref:Uncharacterized protein n=1 Tax=Sesamum radiatum TaxID=300843 RepID=A0AAW2IJB4_SESRA